MLEDGRIFSLVALLAVLFFVVERMLPADSPLRRWLRIAAVGSVAAGMAAALVLGILWLSGSGI